MIPELRVTLHLQGAVTWRIYPPYWISFFAIFYNFFLFLMQFKLWRAAAFVSSPIHLFTSGTEHNEKNIKIHTRTLHSRISRSDIDIESHCRSKYTGVKKAHRNRSHCDFCQSTGWRGHACLWAAVSCLLSTAAAPSVSSRQHSCIHLPRRSFLIFISWSSSSCPSLWRCIWLVT